MDFLAILEIPSEVSSISLPPESLERFIHSCFLGYSCCSLCDKISSFAAEKPGLNLGSPGFF